MRLIVILGLLLSWIGVLLLFRYGMPYRVETKGESALLMEQTDHAAIAKERLYRRLGNLGLGAITIGVALQIIGVGLA